MTAPGYVPPDLPGWWVKDNTAVFAPTLVEVFTGSAPTIGSGTIIIPPAGATTFTSGAPATTIGTLGGPPSGTETLAGGVPQLVTAVYPPAAAASVFTGGVSKVGAQYADSFDRADRSTDLGSSTPTGFPYTIPATLGGSASGGSASFWGWTNRLGVMGIQSNMAYPVTDNQENIATYNPAMIYDDMRVSLIVGTSSGGLADGVVLVLGANTAGECVTARLDNGGGWAIQTRTVWGTATSQANQLLQSYTAGDMLTLERVGNVYTFKQNGVATGLTFTDTTAIVPRNATHRMVGVGSVSSLANYRRINSWTAENI